MKTYSLYLYEKILHAVASGKSYIQKTAQHFSVSKSCVQNLLVQKCRERYPYPPQTRRFCPEFAATIPRTARGNSPATSGCNSSQLLQIPRRGDRIMSESKQDVLCPPTSQAF